MTFFGNFQFRYIAPETDNPLDPSIDFAVTAEADLPQILKVFENFLKANGYDLDSRELKICDKYHTDTEFKGYIPAQPSQPSMVAIGNPEAVTLGLNLGK